MRIPEIRERLFEKAAEHQDAELAELAAELWRRKSTKAPPSSTPITPELQKQIRIYAMFFPNITQSVIGNVFNVSQGRVSEALHGKRT